MGDDIGKKGLKYRIAGALNFVGGTTVQAYDVTADTAGKLWSTIKKVPGLKTVPTGMFTKGLGIIKSDEIGTLEKKISEYEKQIKFLYFEIGKEGAQQSKEGIPLESDTIKKLLADVKEHENEINRLKNRIVEIGEEKTARKIRQKEIKKERAFNKMKETVIQNKATFQQVDKIVENSINEAIKNGVFETRSEEEIFFKIAHDFLDNEVEIKCLAAAELGKIGNDAAVPILMEAVRYDDSDLVSEIINSLISIGDTRAIPLFTREAKSVKYKVRIGCLRGLFKLADDDICLPILMESLKDDHPEVRRTALTFIGWKDYEDAVPGVIQCLVDEEARVRKAAVSTLANLKNESSVLSLIKVLGDKDLEIRKKALEAIKSITGEEIDFDVNIAGKQLSQEVQTLKQWWQDKRISGMQADEELSDYELDAEAETAAEADEAVAADEEEDDEAEDYELDAEADEEAEEEADEADEEEEETEEAEETEEPAEDEAAAEEEADYELDAEAEADEEDEAVAADEVEEEAEDADEDAEADETEEEVEADEADEEAEEAAAAEEEETEEADDYELDAEAEADEVEAADEIEDEPDTEEISNGTVFGPDYESGDEDKTEEPEFSSAKLMRMNKAALLDLCRERGLECDENFTKADIVQMIQGE